MPDTAANDDLEALCAEWGASTYRGPIEDVLARYAGAAREYCADVVVRVTSDCPFCDGAVIDSVIELLLSDPSLDYASNNLKRTWPLGLDAEAFWFATLERAEREAVEPHEREHVTPYVYQHPESFRLANLEAPEWARRPYRLTVDEPADLALARAVYERLDPVIATAADIIGLLDAEPDIAAINTDVRNKDVWRPKTW